MTKLIPFAAVAALVASVGAASADNTFQIDGARSTASSLMLNNVQADQAGTIQVYVDRGTNGFGERLGPTLARAPSSPEANCVVTSSNGQFVHDSRGNVVTC